MDILSPVVDFNTLSMQDLLRARDQFHPHLMHKANVIGTAVGRYRIRKGDLNPSATLALADSVSIPVIASGGLADLDDIRALLQPQYAKLEGAITGRALYDVRLDAKAALALLASQETQA